MKMEKMSFCVYLSPLAISKLPSKILIIETTNVDFKNNSMVMKYNLREKLLGCFPTAPPEAGAILGKQHGDAISTFAFDLGLPQYGTAQYIPNTEFLNTVISEWVANDIQFCGIVHSHPPGQDTLSSGDIEYIEHIMRAMPESIKQLYFPLVFPGEKMISFIATISQNGTVKVEPDHITIVD